MSATVGGHIASLTTKTWDQGPAPITTDEVFAGKTVVVFGVPGAFTPTCSMKHLPGFIEHSQALKDAGADAIVCHSVNDPFVMNAWAKDAGAAEDMVMLADWDASFAKALGVDADMSGAGLGVRAKRYALIAKDKEITYFEVGDLDVSGAETVLAALKG